MPQEPLCFNRADKTILSPKDAKRQQEIIDIGDDVYAYAFAHSVQGADIQALQSVVIKQQYVLYAYLFAKNIPGADINALQQVVIEHGDGWDACHFASTIDGANKKALQQVVLDRGKGVDAYRFAAYVTGADLDALQQVVLDRGDGCDVYHFARDVLVADLSVLRNRLMELHSTISDVNSATGTGNYLAAFDKNADIQARLKIQLAESPSRSGKHNPA